MPASRALRILLGPAPRSGDAAQSGSIAIVFALSLSAFFALLALSIDSSNSYRMRSALQESLDAAALAGARAAATGRDAREAIERYLASNWSANNAEAGFSLDRLEITESEIRLAASSKARSYFSSVIGGRGFELKVQSQVSFGIGDVEVALVMDNTQSMAGAKIEALKTAAHTLVDKITAVPDADSKLKIGLVPFGRYVNVGLAHRNAGWLSVDADWSETSHQCWNTYPDAVKSNCRMETFSGTNDGVPYSYEAEVCDWDYGDPVEQCGDQTSNHVWNGCVGSRDAPLDLDAEVTAANPVPGIMDVGCGAPLTRLSSDWTQIRAGIDAMAVADSTYIPSGLLWGWRVLSQHKPFEDGKDLASDPVPTKVLVLMTDGQNTLSPTYPTHDGGDAAEANAITAELCTRAKAASISIYTVSFQVTDDATRDLLRSCATEPAGAFAAESGAELETAFEEIGGNILALRLAR